MSPEYAMEELFSVKSDVYNFGVLLLEIVSGKRNTSLRSPEHGSIIGYVYFPKTKGEMLFIQRVNKTLFEETFKQLFSAYII